MKINRALLSVSDKTGIVEFARQLTLLGIEIVSTGGTKKVLDEAGIKTISIEEVTGFPEILDGRVKTLHPNVHGALLARRDLTDHMEVIKKHNIKPIDMVVVNLYPFVEKLSEGDKTLPEMIEFIDIGGPSMLRSAAKNMDSVTAIVDPNDYNLVLEEIVSNGNTTLETRKYLAGKVFGHTACYDSTIANYFNNINSECEPNELSLAFDFKQELRYGENSHQSACVYENKLKEKYSILSAEKLNGKELSYNNIKDADAALRIIRDFEKPTVVGLKHMNPCGIGSAETIEKAWDLAYEADSVSIFGGIVVLNRKVDLNTAKKMHELFLEIIIAPEYDEEALNLLVSKKNLRILKLNMDNINPIYNNSEVVSILGGLLVQEQDLLKDDEWEVVTKVKPTEKQLEAMKFGMKAVKHVKSNAIVICNENQTLGIGAGQMNRIGAVEIAIKASEKFDNDNKILASDAFFPMDDSVEYAAKHGIKAIVQPGGSIRDQDSIDKANEYGITMVFTHNRHFRH